MSGADTDNDGKLSASEVTSSFNICNGGPGKDATLLSRVIDAPSSDCPYGGSLVMFGYDGNGDGSLSMDEATQTVRTCQGAPGADGKGGKDGTNGQNGADGANGRDGTDGANGQDGLAGAKGDAGADGKSACAPVVRMTPASVAQCAAGGIVVALGADSGPADPNNANDDAVACDGVLSVSELDDERVVCQGTNGAQGLATRVNVVQEPAGSHCASGGQKIEVGVDLNRNGTLDAAEVDAAATQYVCNGANGANGPNGTNGFSALVRLVPQAASQTCPAGGKKIEVGIDANRNGALDDSEVDAAATQYVCNGADGRTTAVRIAKADRTQCPGGGYVVQTGMDLDASGSLEDSEVTTTTTQCNPGGIPSSSMFTADEANAILSWIGAPTMPWELLYKASVDGANASAFHAAVDWTTSETFFVATLSTGVKIGGYTEANWSGNQGWAYDPSAFLFSLTNNYKHSQSGQYASDNLSTYRYSGYGPTFGEGHDFQTEGYSGYCHLGYTYACRVGSNFSDECTNDFCGTNAGWGWTIVDMEVYGVVR